MRPPLTHPGLPTEQRRALQLLTGTVLHREKDGAFYSGSPRDVSPSHRIHEEPLDCGCRTLGFRTLRVCRTPALVSP